MLFRAFLYELSAYLTLLLNNIQKERNIQIHVIIVSMLNVPP